MNGGTWGGCGVSVGQECNGGGAVRAVKWGRSRFWGVAALTSRFGGGSVRGGPGGGGGRSAVGGSRILGAFQGVLFLGGGSRFRGEGLPVWGEGGGGVPGGAPRTPLAPALLRGSAPTGTGSGTPSHPTPPPRRVKMAAAATRWLRCPQPKWRPRAEGALLPAPNMAPAPSPTPSAHVRRHVRPLAESGSGTAPFPPPHWLNLGQRAPPPRGPHGRAA